MKKNSLNCALKSEYRHKLPFRVDPGEKRVTFVGTSNGCPIAAVDLHERKKHERMAGCLIVDDDGDMKTPLKKQRREPKPNPKYNPYCRLNNRPFEFFDSNNGNISRAFL